MDDSKDEVANILLSVCFGGRRSSHDGGQDAADFIDQDGPSHNLELTNCPEEQPQDEGSAELSSPVVADCGSELTIGESVEICADDSVICLDEDQPISALPTYTQDTSPASSPIDCVTISSSESEYQSSINTNGNDEDFSIVYEKINSPPEVEIIEHYQNTVAQVVMQTEQSALHHLMQLPALNLPIHPAQPEQRNNVVVTISDDDSEGIVVNAMPVIQNNLITSLQQSQRDSIEKKKRKIECPICLDGPDEINTTDRNLVSTVCGHIYCSECLKTAIKTSKKCPQCRKKLSMKQFHPIFV